MAVPHVIRQACRAGEKLLEDRGCSQCSTDTRGLGTAAVEVLRMVGTRLDRGVRGEHTRLYDRRQCSRLPLRPAASRNSCVRHRILRVSRVLARTRFFSLNAVDSCWNHACTLTPHVLHVLLCRFARCLTRCSSSFVLMYTQTNLRCAFHGVKKKVPSHSCFNVIIHNPNSAHIGFFVSRCSLIELNYGSFMPATSMVRYVQGLSEC